ncbi:hypothetical protein OROHE_001240 [Orobanche hederae]
MLSCAADGNRLPPWSSDSPSLPLSKTPTHPHRQTLENITTDTQAQKIKGLPRPWPSAAMVAAKTAGVDSWRTELATALVLRQAVRREGSAAAAVAACGERWFDNFRPTVCSAKMILEVWRTVRIAEVQDGDESENEIEIRVT